MAWFWNKEKKVKQEILSVKKSTDLSIYEVTFNNPCSHCGRKEVRTFNLRMSKDPMEQKAISNYINEQYDVVLKQSLNMANKLNPKKLETTKFAILNKNTLNLDFVSINKLLQLSNKKR